MSLTITALPTPPTREDPDNFADRADAFLAALPTFGAEANALAADVEADALSAEGSATTASTKALEAAASAEDAASTAGASMWDAGTNYLEGWKAISPTDYQTYVRKAPGGVDAVDPASAPTKWEVVGAGRVRRSGDTMTGHLEAIAGATNNQVPRVNEVVGTLSGAAELPSWTTAGRPATPALYSIGHNTDLDCIEEWNGTDWEQEGWQTSGPAISVVGLSAYSISGVPAWANEVVVRLTLVSSNGTSNPRIRPGTAGGMKTSGYAGASVYNNLVGGSTGIGLTTGVFLMANASGVAIYGDIVLRRLSGDIWDISGVVNDQSSGVIIASSQVALGGPLTQVELGLASGTFDFGSFSLAWRK